MSFWNKDAQPIVGNKNVKYGLQPAAKKPGDAGKRTKLSIFGDDDDLDQGGGGVNALLRVQAGTKRSDAKYEKIHAAALAEDANVYDYDSFHDSIQSEREAQQAAARAKEKAGPQYIHALQAAMKEREREQNIAYERRLGRDRKVEDALHGDKEVFVTNTYKQKLREDQLWQASQDLKDKNDAKNSALAKGNMNGVLNLLSTAMLDPASAAAQEAAGGASGNSDSRSAAAAEAASAPVAADILQADLKRRADVKYQKAVAEMDKHELARHKIELRLQERAALRDGAAEAAADQQRRAGDADSTEPAVSASDTSKPGAARGLNGESTAPAASETAGAVKRRADESELSAAKQRYLARKQARLGGT